jgi:hypothetical protein
MASVISLRMRNQIVALIQWLIADRSDSEDFFTDRAHKLPPLMSGHQKTE